MDHPMTYMDAMNSDARMKWKEEMHEEVNVITEQRL